MTYMDKYNTPELHLTLIKAILLAVTSILEENNIIYAIDGGTLLGAMRCKDIISWDDDGDLLMLYSDYKVKLPKVLDKLRKMVIKVDEKEYPLLVEVLDNMTKIFVAGLWATTEAGRIIATPTVDIFRWSCKNDIIRLDSLKQRQQFPNCYYKTSEMFPLKRHQFGELSLWGANDPLGYLHRYYGNDCMNIAKIDLRDPNEKNILTKSDKKIDFKL
jgi:phosphorylcholine metabolism protein LicD